MGALVDMPATISGWEKRRQPSIHAYIKSKTEKSGRCLIWRGGQQGRVGFFQYNYVTGSAPRRVWEAMVGPIPEGLCVLHKCDNPKCVNWKRCLYLGDKKQNRKDFMERHPKAQELVANAIVCGTLGVKRFWKNLKGKEREAFCKMRRENYKKKYPPDHEMHSRRKAASAAALWAKRCW